MSVFIRILLRYGAAALVAKGWFSLEDGNMLASDPEIAQMLEIGVGLGFGALAECWYMLARKFGWSK